MERFRATVESLGMNEDERVYGSLIGGYPDTNDVKPLRKVLPRKGNEVTWL